MRGVTALAALAMLAACGSAAEERRGAAVAEPASTPGPATPAAAEPSDGDWTGRFAVSPELCTGGAWEIGTERIATDGETNCDVDRVARAAGQVTVRVQCLAEGMKSDEEWRLTPGAEGRLDVSRTIGPKTMNVALARCP